MKNQTLNAVVPATTATVVETTEVAAPAKKVKVTFNSLTEARDLKGMIAYLINQGKTLVEVTAVSDLFAQVAAAYPEALKTAVAEKAKQEAERQNVLKLKNDALVKISPEVQQVLEKAVLQLKNSFIEMGLSEQDAMELAATRLGVRKQRQNTKVEVSYNGTNYSVPQIGNVTKALAEVIKESGLSRDEFVKKYAVNQPEVPEVEETTETQETEEQPAE